MRGSLFADFAQLFTWQQTCVLLLLYPTCLSLSLRSRQTGFSNVNLVEKPSPNHLFCPTRKMMSIPPSTFEINSASPILSCCMVWHYNPRVLSARAYHCDNPRICPNFHFSFPIRSPRFVILLTVTKIKIKQ